MKQKTEQELKQNYDKFIAIIKKYFTGERLEKLLHMYSETELGGNLIVSPASGNLNYHNAYTGGYIDHIFNVCKNALKMKKTFEEAGGVCDFTEEELIFVALHHDLGKLGTKAELHYAPNDSEWHIKNQGKMYEFNEDLTSMTIGERSVYYMISNNQCDGWLTDIEYQAILNYDKGQGDKMAEWHTSSLGEILKMAIKLAIMEEKTKA